MNKAFIITITITRDDNFVIRFPNIDNFIAIIAPTIKPIPDNISD